MRALIAAGCACAFMSMALSVSAQNAAPAAQGSDSWSRPASASSVRYRATPASTDSGNGNLRFKDGTEDSRFKVYANPSARPNGKPSTLCQQTPSASTCR